MRRLPQRLTIPLTVLLTTLFCLVLLPLLSLQRHASLLDPTTWRGRTTPPNTSRIARVTVSFNAEGDDIWARAIALQQRHADTHGYPLFVLRRELLPSYWSKPAYLLSVMLRECEKPEAERLRWLFYSDSDVLVTNMALPLSTFLPPSPDFDEVQLLIAEDMLMLNSGVFLLRVGPWALQFLADVIAYETYSGGTHVGSADNYKQDQSAMKYVMSMHRNRRAWLLVPQRWFNGYGGVRDLNNHMAPATPEAELPPAEWRVGDLQIHFPGGMKGNMRPYTEYVERNWRELAVPLAKTNWEFNINAYWFVAKDKRRKGIYDKLTTPLPPRDLGGLLV